MAIITGRVVTLLALSPSEPSFLGATFLEKVHGLSTAYADRFLAWCWWWPD